jgi:ABC-type proline/glycine betaine transport system permease subunit
MKLPFPAALLLLVVGVSTALVGLVMLSVPAAMVVGGGGLAAAVWRGVEV